jgi:hypothetical protein
MSDFDTVLERLLGEPSFAHALAADPAATLAGYRLTAEEIGLLSSQVSADPGGQRAVEIRANKSSVFGLLSPLAGLAGSGGFADHLGGGGEAVGHAAAGGVAAAGQVVGPGGSGPIGVSLGGALGGADGFGAAGDAASGGAGGVTDPGGIAGHGGFGAAQQPEGHAGFGAAQPQPDGFLPPPEGYHTRVDVDGDGDWDRHMLVGRRDGGVDILVDTDRDGRADFVGHDVDGDRLVDSADYDANHDGVFEKTMYDDNGDGWLDRTVKH